MKTKGRVDANQKEIVAALREAGCSVAITSGVGGGFPDIAVGLDGITWLIEIKDGTKKPSEKALTRAEMKFHLGWQGLVEIVESVEEALELIVGGDLK